MKGRDASGMQVEGIDSVTVPGAGAGWQALHQRFGKIAWKELFQPAIVYADEGYPVPEIIASYWKDAAETLAYDPEAQRVYLPGGKSPAVGQVFQNHDLGKALRLVADNSAAAFYKGEVARAILSTAQSLGGTMAADDLADFAAEGVEPISTTYRGWTVYELAPNRRALAALEVLNIMQD